jgi:hypothetical protein
MNHPTGVPWSPSEAAAVNQFLSSEVGRKWLGVLLVRKPKLDLASTERAAMTGAFSAGYEHFFTEIAATRVVQVAEDFSAKAIDPTRD